MIALGSATVAVDVAPGLRLEADVELWAAEGDGCHVAEWSLPRDVDGRYHQVRWEGDYGVVVGVRHVARAYDYLVDAPDSNPVRRAIEDRAQEAADRALTEWLEARAIAAYDPEDCPPTLRPDEPSASEILDWQEERIA